MSTPTALPHVVIIGGGFGGLAAARALSRAPVRVTLVDRRNHHLFQPLLYQVATAGLSAPDIAAPIRKLLRHQRNATVLLDDIERVDVGTKRVIGSTGDLAYDFLVVAAGARNSFFGNDAWEQHAPGMKTLEDALEIRRRVLLAYERAESAADDDARRRLLTFVVIGAGPTGVEMAGALSEIARTTLARDFRRFNPSDARVLLVEGGPRVLPTFRPELSEAAAQQLASIGVEVVLGRRVTSIDNTGIDTDRGRIEAATVVWAAGVRAEAISGTVGAATDRAGRLIVNADLTVGEHADVFAVGDIAAFKQGDQWVPGVAPAAMQQGRHAAANIVRRLRGETPEPFSYFDKGSMATIGRRRAVAITGVGTLWPRPAPAMRFRGLLAWLAWLLVHILYLVDFRNRLAVLWEWAWAYITYQRSARVILNHTPPPLPPGYRP